MATSTRGSALQLRASGLLRFWAKILNPKPYTDTLVNVLECFRFGFGVYGFLGVP